MTLRDGMKREVGGGFGMGNTCIPMAQVNVWQNHYNIVKQNKFFKKERYRHPYVHNSTIHNSQDMETILVSKDR